MSIASLWERSTALLLKRYGVCVDTLSISPFTMKSLRIQGQRSRRTTAWAKRLVCVHGLGSSGSAYGGLLPLLSSHWNDVWAPSAPSHGMSPRVPQELLEGKHAGSSKQRDRFQSIIYQAWERCLLNLSEEAPIDLFGVSLGGAVAIRFSARYPKRVASLMLCSPAGAVLDEDDIEHLKDVFRMTERGDGLRFLNTLYHQVPWWGPLLAPLVQRSLSRPEAQELIFNLKPGDGIRAEEFSQLSMPVLLIWGERERVLPSSILQKLIKNAPQLFTLLRPEGFSHTPQKEDPAALLTYLIRFQEEVSREEEL